MDKLTERLLEENAELRERLSTIANIAIAAWAVTLLALATLAVLWLTSI